MCAEKFKLQGRSGTRVHSWLSDGCKYEPHFCEIFSGTPPENSSRTYNSVETAAHKAEHFTLHWEFGARHPVWATNLSSGFVPV